MFKHELTIQQLSIMYGQHKLYHSTHHGIISFREFCKQEYNGTFSSLGGREGSITFNKESDYTMFLLQL